MKKNKDIEEKSSNASSSGNYASSETCENLEPESENKPEIALASDDQPPKIKIDGLIVVLPAYVAYEERYD